MVKLTIFRATGARPLISSGPSEPEGVADGWERVIDPSVGEVESDVCKTSPTGLGTMPVHAKLVLSKPLFADLSLSMPGNDK